ncbi:universal stress protein [Noviherbaspirillum saxi]|uniref:Universal stress protein n=1 Tax=Noviherbaspirillum saxi TaxID=2320863 RepID=A0A3A3FFL1_9BURK|nr:universal stress protein [Noviherbaspirillum saxi]RJF92040.1 universal stress protein [Noviherbaspirillum saxi]
MYRSILVAYNGTPESRSALHECIRLTPPSSTQVHLLAVIHPHDPLVDGEYGARAAYSTQEMMQEEQAKMERELAEGCRMLQEAGLNTDIFLETGEPADIISNMAAKLGADLVIVGHPRHRSWVQRWWRGSTDALLLGKVHCTLMIAPERAEAA